MKGRLYEPWWNQAPPKFSSRQAVGGRPHRGNGGAVPVRDGRE